MRKLIGTSLAILFALPLAAGAAEIKGTIKSVNPGESTIVLEDGTALTMHESNLQGLQPGMTVEASYQEMDGKKIVTEVETRVVVDGQETTNFAPPQGQ